ncbi:carbohydrate ABC transporter permease [Metarhizobium album]|uniref:Carbohydrate ABC transporter permease n=1 Tax=Metarhizobium album TaxID=2182425 RepID=A0A2U2DNF9_9HYPH|nr:carbohydrate ABC transporter permease [Rhizobium album]PWE54858.1 carbohydrate ABC transporter permease [Rhizobium album]
MTATSPIRIVNRRERLRGAAVFAALALWTSFALAPIAWIVLMSFKQGSDIIAWPPKFIDFTPTLDNFRAVLTLPDFLAPFRNTLIVTLGSVALSLLIGLPAAYAIARMRLPAREHIAFSFVSLRFAPELFVVLPLFVLYRTLQLNNTYLGLIIAYQLVCFPLIVWLMRSFYEEIPREIEEAVAVDGGSIWTKFRIATRMSLTGILASAVLAFIFSWNSYALPLVLAGKNTQVITGAILGFMKFADVQWGQMAAGTIIAIVPSLVFTALLVGRMVDGMTAGAVKG